MSFNPCTGIMTVHYRWLGDETRKFKYTTDVLSNASAGVINWLKFEWNGRIERAFRNYLKLQDIDDIDSPSWLTQVKPLVDAEEALPPGEDPPGRCE